tara:strand:- start:410 stop:643 length:234 start_codon:yes stop_codon:yes gene_type:complete
MDYKIGDLVELLSFFDRMPTGVYGVVIAVYSEYRTVYDQGYPSDYNLQPYYKIEWYDFPDLPGTPTYPEDIKMIQEG